MVSSEDNDRAELEYVLSAWRRWWGSDTEQRTKT